MAQDSRFDILRRQAKQQTTAGTQAQKEALKRRFAQLGQGTSGAAIKAEQLAAREGEKQLGSRLGQIDIAEQTEKQRKQEIEEARQFQRGEREASQAFGAEQAAIARQFATGEREAGQAFAAEQASVQRDFQSELQAKQRELQERLQAGQISFQQAENEKNRLQQASQFLTQLKEARSQFDKQMAQAAEQFEEEVRVNNFNMQTADRQLKEPGIIGGILEDLGLGGLVGEEGFTGRIVSGGEDFFSDPVPALKRFFGR